MNPDNIINAILPVLIQCARYSRQIQGNIKGKAEKSGGIFESALSDADLSIQTAVEVALLAEFPGLPFFGEEKEHSYNTPYLTTQGDLTLLLDPIDGTRFFLDGHDSYQIVCSIVSDEDFEAAIALYPALECYVGARRGKGAFRGSFDDLDITAVQKHTIDSSGEVVILGVHADIELSRELSSFGLTEHYQLKGNSPNLGDIVRGQLECDESYEGLLGGYVSKNSQHIDNGALGFIVREAGGIVTAWDGSPLPKISECDNRVFPNSVLALNEKLHSRLIQELKDLI